MGLSTADIATLKGIGINMLVLMGVMLGLIAISKVIGV